MAISCTPAALVEGAGCLSCLDQHNAEYINTYLLQQLLDNTDTPAQLLEAAKAFSGMSLKQLLAVQAYLLCQLVNA